jgi:tetratricopeptide (TPR) repeat protein
MGRFFSVGALALASFSTAAQTTVILPFHNRTANEADAWIGESIAEELTAEMAGEGYLTVNRKDRDEVFRRLGVKPSALLTRATALKVAMNLDASHVVYGRFEAAHSEIRISADITDVKGLQSLGQMIESGPRDRLSELQSRLAWRAMKIIREAGAPDREEFLARHPCIKLEALEAFVRGLHAAHPDIRNREFAQAARLDPGYAAPAFELGKLHFERKQWQEAALWLSRVNPSDTRAGEALFFLGLARFHLEDFVASRDAFAAVAQRFPLNEVMNNLGAAQLRLSQPEAADSFRQALEGAESDPDYHFNAGYALLLGGEYSQAAERFRAVLERNPSDAAAMEMLGRCLRPESGKPVPPGRERLKTDYAEATFLQLKAVLSPRASK